MVQQLYQLPVYWIGLVIFILLCAVALVGHLIGRRRRDLDTSGKEVGGMVVGAILAILGLVLAFTYGYNLTRYETRRAAIASEANAAGTVFLRAGLLPAAESRDLRQAILDYTRTRVFHDLGNPATLGAEIETTLRAQALLWPLATRLSEGRLAGPERVFLLGAMNDLIDDHTSRVAVATERMPIPVMVFAFGLAAAAVFLTAFDAGGAARTTAPLLGLYAFVIAGIFALILDFDQPGTGLIRIDSAIMKDAIADMQRILAEPD